ncbi:hypothetical protein BD414DRAFT_488705 [Trametes punicea]|nr:hypothetical protein BD414DRAFT_488705 [Trametes punicea]
MRDDFRCTLITKVDLDSAMSGLTQPSVDDDLMATQCCHYAAFPDSRRYHGRRNRRTGHLQIAPTLPNASPSHVSRAVQGA